MRMMLLGWLILLGSITTTWAQTQPGLPLSISVFDQNVSFPTYRVVQDPIHPGIRIGTEVWQRGHGNWQRGLQLSVAGYLHPHLYHAVWLDAQYSFRYQIYDKLGVSFTAGAGYQHSFNSATRYELTEAGIETFGPGFGKPNAVVTASVNVHVGLPGDSPKKPELMVGYQVGAQTFPSPAFPVIPRTYFHVGFRFYPFAN